MHFSTLISIFSAAVSLTVAQSQLPLPSKQIYQFPVGTWIENVAVRTNGKLLLTLRNTPSLYSLDPTAIDPTPELVHVFTEHTSLFGLAELPYQTDIYIVAAGNITNQVGQMGSFALWKVDMSQSPAIISKVVEIPEAQLLNGVYHYGGDIHQHGLFLAADSMQGLLYKVNIETGNYTVDVLLPDTVQIPEMAPAADATLGLGVNGLKDFLSGFYWTNTERKTIYRGSLTYSGQASGYEKPPYLFEVGSVEVVKAVDTQLDDFAIDAKGYIWATTGGANTLIVVDSKGGQVDVPEGEMRTVLGSSGEFTVAGATSAAFGRTEKDAGILYVGTNGGLAQPVNGTGVEGGKVVAVDTNGFSF